MRSPPLLALALAMVGAACSAALDPPPPAAGRAPVAAESLVFDPRTTRAVIIGVLSFEDPGVTSFSDRNRKDQELADTLVAMGVPTQNITVLLDRAATWDAMLRAVEAQASAAEPGSMLLFYYAGHGSKGPGGEVGFLSHDARARPPVSTLALGRLLAATFRGSKVLFLADCCHSGGLADAADLLRATGRISASSITSAESSNLSTENWTFTQTVIDGLRGDPLADRDRDGRIELGELASEVRDAMKFREKQRSGDSLAGLGEEFALARTASPFPAPSIGTAPAPGSYVEAEREGGFAPARVVGHDSGLIVEFYDYSDKSRSARAPSQVRPVAFGHHPPGSRLRVTWGGTIWDADVLRVDGDFHLITYPGWPSYWDEWISSHRVVGTR